MVKDFEMMILSWWAPNAVTSDLLRGNQGDLTQREEKPLENGAGRDLNTLAMKLGMMQPQARECQLPLEARRKEWILPQKLPEEQDHAHTLFGSQ